MVNAQTYVIEIEKAGFKYSFKKPDGTVIAGGHQQSGIRYTAPGGGTLFDAVSTELAGYDEEKVKMTVANAAGQHADVTIYPFATYAKFDISPRDDGGELPAEPAQPDRSLRLKQTDMDDAAAIAGETSWAYDKLESRIMIEASTGSSASGVVFGYKSDTSYYYARLHDKNQELQLLRTKSDGSGTLEVVKKVSLSIAKNVWYDLKIELADGQVKIGVNGQEQLSWSDASADFNGQIGVKSFKTTVHFDDMRISQEDTPLYADDFQSSDTSGWTVQRGELVIFEAANQQTEEPAPQSENVMVFDSLSTENGLARTGTGSWQYDAIEADLLIEKSSGSSASGLVFGYQSPTQYYYVRLHDAKGEVQLLKTDSSGTLKVVASKKDELINKNVWYNLKATMTGNTISVFVDGVKKVEWTDSGAAFAGEIGVKAFKSTVQYGGIKAENAGSVVYHTDFASADINEWTLDEGRLFVQKRVENRLFMIDARTASIAPAYGLGDDGRFGGGSNVFGFSEADRSYVENNGTTSRFISNFVVFPKQGFAQVLFDEDGKKRVALNAAENKMGVSSAERIDRLYYFVGDMKQIYADYQQVRFAEGYPEFQPKSNFFEVGYEAFGSLGWNTAQTTVTEDIKNYLDQGYRLKWAVVGSGFWKGDRNDPEQAITTSFGMWDDTYQEGRTDSYPNPRYPDVEGFKSFFRENGIKFLLGLRTNFKALPEDEGFYNPNNDGPYTQEGLDNGYFVKSAALDGAAKKFDVNAFPNGPVYLLNPEAPGAVEWFKNGADLWGVDGFKEDTMARAPSSDSLWNKPNEALMQAGYEVMVRNAAYSVPGDIIRLEDTRWDYDQDRPVLVALSMAASGAPNVYSDIVAGKSLPKKLTEDQKLYFVRNATFAALTPAMSMGLGPWKMGNTAYESDVKKAVDFHSAYAPYIYSAAVDSFETGFPYTMTPLPIAYPNDANTYDLANTTTRQYEWMLGESMLAAPLFGNDLTTATSRDVYLPEGKWIEYETGKVYNGPTTLESYELPLDKVPVFIGGKGVLVKRDLESEALLAEVYPIAANGSEFVYTYPDGASKSRVVNRNTGWNKDTLVITDTTAGDKVDYVYDDKTGHYSFALAEGHNYELTGGGASDNGGDNGGTDGGDNGGTDGGDNGGTDGGNNGGTDGGNNGGTDNGVQPVPEEPVRVVTDAELKQAEQAGKVLIQLDGKQASVRLPASADQLRDGDVIQIESGKLRFTIPAKVLRQLSANAGEAERDGYVLDIASSPYTTAQLGAWGDDLRPISEASSRLSLALKLRDGKSVGAEELPDGVRIEIGYEPGQADAELLGIYRFDQESGKWVYTGGATTADHAAIAAAMARSGEYALLERHKAFGDVPNTHWAFRTLQVLAARHVVNGVSDTLYAPTGLTTRAEFTALLVRAMGLRTGDGDPAGAAATFNDVSTDDWFAGDVSAAYNAGLVQGVSDASFAPDARISREQMAAMIVRAYEYANGRIDVKTTDLNVYADIAKLSGWAAEDVRKAVAAGLMQGTAADAFNPGGNATRAQTAQAVYNLLNRLDNI